MLSESKKLLLRKFVSGKCEGCGRIEKDIGKLSPHRIQQGRYGGKYILRNIIMLCNYSGTRDFITSSGKLVQRKSCHKMIHQGEYK